MITLAKSLVLRLVRKEPCKPGHTVARDGCTPISTNSANKPKKPSDGSKPTRGSSNGPRENSGKKPTPANKDSKFVHKPLVKEASDTQHAYKKPDGTYTKERQALHKKLIDGVLAKAKPVKNPVAIMLGGGPGAGKTTIKESGVIGDLSNTVDIAADEFKTKIPEFARGVEKKDPETAGLVHRESVDIADAALIKASESKKSHLLDGTGNSTIEYLKANVADMRRGGHKVIAHYVTIPIQTAIERAEKRRKETGRGISTRVVIEKHKAVSAILPEAMKQNVFDEVNLWDNSGRKPIKVMSHVDGKTIIHDKKKWKEFLDKANHES